MEGSIALALSLEKCGVDLKAGLDWIGMGGLEWNGVFLSFVFLLFTVFLTSVVRREGA